MSYANLHLRRFNHLISEMGALYHEAALKFGLPESVLEVLYTVGVEGDGCLIGVIIEQTGMAKQTLNSALRRLEADGSIILKTDGGRRKRIFLTETGRELAQRTAVHVIEIENRIFDTWTQQERDSLIELTRRYTDAFRKGIEELR